MFGDDQTDECVTPNKTRPPLHNKHTKSTFRPCTTAATLAANLIYMAYARPPAVFQSMRLGAWLDIVELKVDPEGNDTGPHKQDEEGDDEVPKGTK